MTAKLNGKAKHIEISLVLKLKINIKLSLQAPVTWTKPVLEGEGLELKKWKFCLPKLFCSHPTGINRKCSEFTVSHKLKSSRYTT